MKTEAIYITKKNVQRRTISQMILNSKFIGLVAEVLSMILGEKISPKKAIKVLNVQAAITSLMIFGGISPLIAVVLLAWMGLAVYQCRM
ncbi:MAG: hypothetical protein SPG95_00945 [Bacteroidaceae bacterium]|nr:hypothetical protein [Bacteroidaceae bacterium]MCI7082837.1 hypothetical protein [Paraprevotella sp.]MDD7242779.1 hypothetical protein [Paraprevotella sp.]MDY2716341.1 hypothetical protein [Bacteroidaceae bacterium]MDY4615178.1 hypothetical protein [Bacteroidaceae bacterium]